MNLKCTGCGETMKHIYTEEEHFGRGKKRALKVFQCQNKKCKRYSEIDKVPE
jgi:hypothetical protein